MNTEIQWVPVAERLPEYDAEVLVWPRPQQSATAEFYLEGTFSCRGQQVSPDYWSYLPDGPRA